MDEDFKDLKCVGDVVAMYVCKLYHRTNYNFYADPEYLKSEWINNILKEKFDLDKLSTRGFKNWNTYDVFAKQYGKDISKKYLNAKMFKVEDMRQFLNEKYKDYEIK